MLHPAWRRITPDAAHKLVRSALIFAQSNTPSLCALAQSIAYCLVDTPISDAERLVCRHILATIGNFPAADFVAADVSRPALLPWQLEVTELIRREKNTVSVVGERTLLTDFQLDVWRELHAKQYITVSAPTSAGKSFVIQAYVSEYIESNYGVLDIVYLVPSRSLINEIQGTLTRELGKLSRPVTVSSVPRARLELAAHEPRVFVFTQERLRTALDDGLLPDLEPPRESWRLVGLS